MVLNFVTDDLALAKVIAVPIVLGVDENVHVLVAKEMVQRRIMWIANLKQQERNANPFYTPCKLCSLVPWINQSLHLR